MTTPDIITLVLSLVSIVVAMRTALAQHKSDKAWKAKMRRKYPCHYPSSVP